MDYKTKTSDELLKQLEKDNKYILSPSLKDASGRKSYVLLELEKEIKSIEEELLFRGKSPKKSKTK